VVGAGLRVPPGAPQTIRKIFDGKMVKASMLTKVVIRRTKNKVRSVPSELFQSAHHALLTSGENAIAC